ncbi:MAG: hypothetical protein LBC99_10015 [Spirochaetota bacterium]|jgi:predicted helicase|nr:hypothetical protein [Spirochaetota bacterium]
MSKAEIFYKDIGDYLSREEKLRIVREGGSILNPALGMTRLAPNEHGDWIHTRNSNFDDFIPLAPEKKFDKGAQAFFTLYSLGIATNKDAWLYNYSLDKLEKNVKKMVAFYNGQRIAYHKLPDAKKREAKDCVEYDLSKITWTDMFLKDIEDDVAYTVENNKICTSLYRPFTRLQFFNEKQFIQRTYQQTKLFPENGSENRLICVSGVGVTKNFSCIITELLPDLEVIGKSQCFPLYWYEKKNAAQSELFRDSADAYIRHDAVSDFILDQAKTRYGGKIIKEDIFYYVYGILHHPEYRRIFANDLKKMLPRLPLVEKAADFWAFSKAGRDLADLHLNYEDQPPLAEICINGMEIEKWRAETGKRRVESGEWKVHQMKFPAKGQKDTILYNAFLTISNIPPKAYTYIVNGKSAIEWIMERYAITTHKESGIQNNPNDWAEEHNNPQYILDLLLSVIAVSAQTMDIVVGLPDVQWE